MASEITHCLIQIDLIGTVETEKMMSDEMFIYQYCLIQGAKNNTGIFIESRFDIAKKLKIDHDITYLFFEKFPNIIGFCPNTHLIWAKPFFGRVDLGLMNDIWIIETDGTTGRAKKTVQPHIRNTKNRFVDKINKTFKEPLMAANGEMFFLKTHPLGKEWIKKNYFFLEMINEDVKSVAGNTHNLDQLLEILII
tara:strand:- start:462 stop:1043 length:582 start_codon:yes stop_codon:yes gene_type:complete